MFASDGVSSVHLDVSVDNNGQFARRTLVKSDRANDAFSPNRQLDADDRQSLEVGVDDIFVQCIFANLPYTEDDEKRCFGLITYYPPLPLSTCTSIPYELSLETAFNMELFDYNDQDGGGIGKKRKKRQASNVINGFLDRDLDDTVMSVSKVRDWFQQLAQESVQSNVDRNDALLSLPFLPICAENDAEYHIDETDPVTLPEADPVQLEDIDVCRAKTTTTTTTTPAPTPPPPSPTPGPGPTPPPPTPPPPNPVPAPTPPPPVPTPAPNNPSPSNPSPSNPSPSNPSPPSGPSPSPSPSAPSHSPSLSPPSPPAPKKSGSPALTNSISMLLILISIVAIWMK